MKLLIGQKVRVIDQDIVGVVVETYNSTVIIEDENSEYDWPDNRLEYRQSELEEIE